MRRFKSNIFILTTTIILSCLPAMAQGDHHKKLLEAIIVDGDTIGMMYLDNIDIVDKLPADWKKNRAAYLRLRRNVYKTYPYAVIAAGVLKDAEYNMAQMSSKKEKKAYQKSLEKELKKRFKGELEDMTISQGQVLVKLINRQSGRNVFGIIKQVKGGFNAVVYQSFAMLFKNNLRKEYDPEGDDKMIEMIVREIEAKNYRHYQNYLKERAAKSAKK